MRKIAASIIVFSASNMIIASAFVAHNDTKMVVGAAGFVLALMGMIGFFLPAKTD